MTRLVRWQVPDWDKHLLDVAEYLMGKFSKHLHLSFKSNLKRSINTAVEHVKNREPEYTTKHFIYRLG